MLYDITESGLLNEGSIVVFGDIHGRFDLLKEQLDEIAGFGAQVVFLGDYIDRGEQGVEVLQRILELTKNPALYGFSRVTALMGNHEHMALLAAVTGSYVDMHQWLRNGGRIEEFPAIKNDYKDWMSSLPLYYQHEKKVWYKEKVKHLVCSHASVDPTKLLGEQNPDTLIWGRTIRGFDHDTITVHGHTPVAVPQFYETTTGDVIRLDTGAWRTDNLSAAVFEEVEQKG